jgi:hypothetical protein
MSRVVELWIIETIFVVSEDVVVIFNLSSAETKSSGSDGGFESECSSNLAIAAASPILSARSRSGRSTIAERSLERIYRCR